MSSSHDPTVLPDKLPVPQDDGGCDHLLTSPGNRLPPELEMECTDGAWHRLVDLTTGPTVLFFYPRTGVPGQPPNRGFSGEDWDDIPGARGCTPQSCGFRDLAAEFLSLGVRVLGVSTNTREHQLEFKRRMHVPFEFLSDRDLRLTRAMHLPTFEFPVESGGPTTLFKRMAWFVEPDEAGAVRIAKVWYPVFPSSQNAQTVLAWLRTRAERSGSLKASERERRREVERQLVLRPIEPRDRAVQRDLFTKHFGGTLISSRTEWIETLELPGIVCELSSPRGNAPRIAGIACHTPPAAHQECELVALACAIEGIGAGSKLLEACVQRARASGASRIFLTTSNDNVDALRFYQLRGWKLAKLYPGALEAARRAKPEIPLCGPSGVEIRDDLELEVRMFNSQSIEGP